MAAKSAEIPLGLTGERRKLVGVLADKVGAPRGLYVASLLQRT